MLVLIVTIVTDVYCSVLILPDSLPLYFMTRHHLLSALMSVVHCESVMGANCILSFTANVNIYLFETDEVYQSFNHQFSRLLSANLEISIFKSIETLNLGQD